MNVYKLFPTTVIEFDLRGYPNKNKLLEYMETTHMHNETGVIKGKNTYQSNPNFLSNYKFIDLKNIIQKHINTYTQLLGLNHTHITGSWFNIFNKENYIQKHHHGNSIVSGAYYPLLEENSCKLIYSTPLYSSINFNTNNSTSYNYNTFEMPIKQDHLYLFPGWLEHLTEENQSKKRIVLSFNTKYNN